MPTNNTHWENESDSCSQIPHPFMSVFVFWCPHLQRWGGWIDLGHSTHESTECDSRELKWGPFDSTLDVEHVLQDVISVVTLDRLRAT